MKTFQISLVFSDAKLLLFLIIQIHVNLPLTINNDRISRIKQKDIQTRRIEHFASNIRSFSLLHELKGISSLDSKISCIIILQHHIFAFILYIKVHKSINEYFIISIIFVILSPVFNNIKTNRLWSR